MFINQEIFIWKSNKMQKHDIIILLYGFCIVFHFYALYAKDVDIYITPKPINMIWLLIY